MAKRQTFRAGLKSLETTLTNKRVDLDAARAHLSTAEAEVIALEAEVNALQKALNLVTPPPRVRKVKDVAVTPTVQES